MSRFSLGIFILIAFCVTHNQIGASPFPHKGDVKVESNSLTYSETITDADVSADSNTSSDTDKGISSVEDINQGGKRKTTARSVRNRYQKTFIRNPNYYSANKLFEEESKKSYMRRRYKTYPLPHPGFKVGEKENKNC